MQVQYRRRECSNSNTKGQLNLALHVLSRIRYNLTQSKHYVTTRRIYKHHSVFLNMFQLKLCFTSNAHTLFRSQAHRDGACQAGCMVQGDASLTGKKKPRTGRGLFDPARRTGRDCTFPLSESVTGAEVEVAAVRVMQVFVEARRRVQRIVGRLGVEQVLDVAAQGPVLEAGVGVT